MRKFEINLRRDLFVPIGKALGLTLCVYIIVLSLVSILGAYSIWIQGHYDPKFGDQWGNFMFFLQIFSVVIGGQCGILFIGYLASVSILKKVISLPVIAVTIAFIIVNELLFVFGLDGLSGFLIFYPVICVILIIVGCIIEKRFPSLLRRDSGQCSL